jgi:hypothetical protein
MAKASPSSYRSLGLDFKIDQVTVKTVLLRAGVTMEQLKTPEGLVTAREVLTAYKADYGKQSGTKTDPGPRQRKFEEEVKLLERKNRIEAQLESHEYMLTSDVEKIINLGLKKLELVPVKLQSEFSLDEKLVKRLTELQDEAREAWGIELSKVNA